jgi:ADP-L-glycero-D-manno-heptose 6-epimerase
MLIVTGGAGFIGSNLVFALNRAGYTDLLVVDNFSDYRRPAEGIIGTRPELKRENLAGAEYTQLIDKVAFREDMKSGKLDGLQIDAILHQGACSNTLEDDVDYMMDNNYMYSRELLDFALARKIPFVYASTAAVYGLSEQFAPVPANEHPLNVYGESKRVFDNYVRLLLPKAESTVVGLRYFNVYGPHELHKGRMASVIHHFTEQLKSTGTIRMFEGSGGYGPGEQRRDFVFVGDLCRMNLFFAGLGDGRKSKRVFKGVVNAGTGSAHTFNQVAQALFEVHGKGKIEYVPFPADLAGRYQHFTQADITSLREMGYREPFTRLRDGVLRTFEQAAP